MGEPKEWYGGEEQTVEHEGKTYCLGRMRRKAWKGFTRFARETLPDPVGAILARVDEVALADCKVMRELMRQDAADKAKHGPKSVTLADKWGQLASELTSKATDKAASYLNFGSPELWGLLSSYEGQVEMVYLLLQEHHGEEVQGETGRDLADDIVNAQGPAWAGRVFKTAYGHTPEKKKEEDPEDSPPPSAPAAPARSTGTGSTAASSVRPA